MPALTSTDIDMLMEIALVEEAAPPDAPLPGYDLDAAAAEGWSWRAGELAEQRKVGAEGVSAENQQRFEHALKMVEHYRTRRSPGSGSAVPTSTKFRRTDVIR
jgi:hypothetical protein